MITGLGQTVDYVLKDDKENPTIWKISCLNYKVFLKIGATASGSENQGMAAIEAVRHGLKDVMNYKGSVPFSADNGVVSEAFLETVHPMYLMELGTKIINISTLNETERKN